jgi:hypothetical protein
MPGYPGGGPRKIGDLAGPLPALSFARLKDGTPIVTACDRYGGLVRWPLDGSEARGEAGAYRSAHTDPFTGNRHSSSLQTGASIRRIAHGRGVFVVLTDDGLIVLEAANIAAATSRARPPSRQTRHSRGISTSRCCAVTFSVVRCWPLQSSRPWLGP